MQPWEHESSKTFNSPEKLNFSQMVSHALMGITIASAIYTLALYNAYRDYKFNKTTKPGSRR